MVLRPRPEQLSQPKRVYRGTQNKCSPDPVDKVDDV